MATKKRAKVSASKKRQPRKGTHAYKEWLKRSKANKKGWVTRRNNARIREQEKREQLEKELQGGIPDLSGQFNTIVRFQKDFPEEAKKEGWVNAADLPMTRRDGTIAVERSIARHFGKWTEYILEKMREAHEEGPERFDEMVADLAHDFNIPVRELYTLWFSP